MKADAAVRAEQIMNGAAEFRNRVLEVLELIADDRAQLEYQRRAPDVDVADELFNQWEDSYHADDAVFCRQFSAIELRAMATFDNLARLIAEETPQQLPPLHEFMKTSAWLRLSSAAALALNDMNRTWRNGLASPH